MIGDCKHKICGDTNCCIVVDDSECTKIINLSIIGPGAIREHLIGQLPPFGLLSSTVCPLVRMLIMHMLQVWLELWSEQNGIATVKIDAVMWEKASAERFQPNVQHIGTMVYPATRAH